MPDPTVETETLLNAILETPIELFPTESGRDYRPRVRSKPPETWIVDGLLPPGCISILGGQPKDGKSTFARYLMRQILRGEPFLGRATEKVPCVYFCLEDIDRRVVEHFDKMGMPDDGWVIIEGPLQDDYPTRLEKLGRTLDYTPNALVIIDTMSQFFQFEDLNDYKLVRADFDAFIDIFRQTNAHCLLLHHLNKAGRGIKSFLGTTGLTAAVDVVMTLNPNRNGRRFDSKLRGGLPFEGAVISMHQSDGTLYLVSGGAETESAGASPQGSIDMTNVRIIEFLADGPQTSESIVKALKMSRKTAIKHLAQLVKAGLIGVTGDGTRGDPKIYMKSEV